MGVDGAGAAVCSGSAVFGAPVAASPPPGVADLPPSRPAPVVGADWLGAEPVVDGALTSPSPVLEVSVPLPLEEPLGSAACSARAFSISARRS